MSKSHYKKIKGQNYDRKMLEIAENSVAQNPSGKISTKDAKAIFEAAIDANVLTEIEKATLDYIYENYPFIKSAENYLKNEISHWIARNEEVPKPKEKPAPLKSVKTDLNEDEKNKIKSELKLEIEKDLEKKLKPALKDELRLELSSSLEPTREAALKLASQKTGLSFGEKEELKTEIQQNLKTSLSSEVRYNLKSDLKSEIMDELSFGKSSTDKGNGKIYIFLLVLLMFIIILQLEICSLKSQKPKELPPPTGSSLNSSVPTNKPTKEESKKSDVAPKEEFVSQEPIQEEDVKTIESLQIPFVKNSYGVNSKEAEENLRKLVLTLRKNPNLRVQVIGHTCNEGTDKVNKMVSVSRAKSIAEILKNVGIKGNRIEVIGASDSEPIADNSTSTGREKNRRVQFKVIR
ncbi:MAG: OmpA family protein [Leptospiraceae bacterium]|nr:OmpA family protein [Leptospiraceae bacterium]